MKTSWKDEAVSLLMIGAMFVIAAAMWSRVPARMPVHWGWSGQVDRLGGRFEGLFGLPLAALGVYVLLLLLPRVDPRRPHYTAFAAPYRAIRTLMVVMFLALQVFLLARVERPDMPASVLPAVLGVVFIALGNYLPKVQSNWFVGVRTPWTLSSEESWRRTHRLAGWLFVISGALTSAIALVRPSAGMPALLTTLGATAIASIVYSYFVWRRDPGRVPATDLE